MAKYFLSNKAIEDLSGIWKYTFYTWSEKQADKYYNTLIDNCKFIADNPQIGKDYSNILNSLRGYKVEHHIIFYKKIDSKTIIIRILHERMDIKNRIKE